MAGLILHHHDPSPFAEKIRLVFGLKGLAWDSVQLSMVMPRPDLMPLTGGYRKVPVLQVGADVYCDTRLIAVELERRHPAPSLFPDGVRGLALALSSWSDRAFFDPGAGLSMGLNQALIPREVLDDRKGFFNFMDFDRLEADLPHLRTQFRAHAGLVELQRADGRAYLGGDRPGLTDIHAWFPLWMARGNLGEAAQLLAPFGRLQAWEQRMRAIGHGRRSELDSQSALAVARSATPLPGRGVDPDDALGLAPGERVSVTPDDYGRIPVTGALVTLELHEVAIRRDDPAVGAVVVHFPRIGYRVERAAPGAPGQAP